MHTDNSHCNLHVAAVSTGCEAPAERMESERLSLGRQLTDDRMKRHLPCACPGAPGLPRREGGKLRSPDGLWSEVCREKKHREETGPPTADGVVRLQEQPSMADQG